MILVTGAGGKTGKALVRRLASKEVKVRAWVHHAEQIPSLIRLGAADVIYGDMMQVGMTAAAFQHVDMVYHICSNMNPFEEEICQRLLDEASKQRVRLFGYHSVFHPQIQQMPHHWKKLMVESAIFRSGLKFIILQPTAYMQNILAYWMPMTTQGLLPLPYAPQTRLSLVDLEDVVEAASNVILDRGNAGGIYELVGTPALSQLEVAECMSQKLGRVISVEPVSQSVWAEQARKNGMEEYAVSTLLKMFDYYEAYGMWGSPKVLESILDRPATSLDKFMDRTLSETINS
jgi:uncharacterized protein YbjT (DUF2867 family)